MSRRHWYRLGKSAHGTTSCFLISAAPSEIVTASDFAVDSTPSQCPMFRAERYRSFRDLRGLDPAPSPVFF
jgi:hypothetical protein